MAKIKLFDINEDKLDQKIREFNLQQAKKHLSPVYQKLQSIFPDYDERLLDKYEKLVADAIDAKIDVPYEYATTKKLIKERESIANSAIIREVYQIQDQMKMVVRNQKDRRGNDVKLNRSFINKNIKSDLISKDYFLVDELAEIGPKKNEEQQYLFKTLLNSGAYDKYELDNPMERAIMRRDKQEILYRVSFLGEYISKKTLYNASLEIKDIDKQINNILNENPLDTELKKNTQDKPVSIKNEKTTKMLEEYKEEIKNVLSFAVAVNYIQDVSYSNKKFQEDLRGIAYVCNFNDDDYTFTLMNNRKNIAVKSPYGSIFLNDNGKWQAITPQKEKMVANKLTESYQFDSFLKARNTLLKRAFKRAFETNSPKMLEDLINKHKANVELIDIKDLNLVANGDVRVEMVETINEAIDHTQTYNENTIKEMKKKLKMSEYQKDEMRNNNLNL